MAILFYLILFIIVLPLLSGIIAMLLHAKKKRSTATDNVQIVPSLLFHSVTKKSTFDQSHVTTEKFKKVISYLNNNNYTTLTAYETAHSNRVGKDENNKTVSLIFDDGFEDFFTNAFPILQEYNLNGSVFPVVDSIGDKLLWDVYAPKKCLSKKQITTIADAGHEIGSHTLSHADLRMLSDKDLDNELSISKKILEDITGKPVRTISFPFGSWNNRVWEWAQKCGYQAAVAYRNHAQAFRPIIPITGVYNFDSVSDIIEKIEERKIYSNTRARSAAMPHFAKGTPMWKFRRIYSVFNAFR